MHHACNFSRRAAALTMCMLTGSTLSLCGRTWTQRLSLSPLWVPDDNAVLLAMPYLGPPHTPRGDSAVLSKPEKMYIYKRPATQSFAYHSRIQAYGPLRLSSH
ncbi:hypothetical protein EV424DRAFT_1543251 [Suillus variegatus]|nr:hypothetical protein EV424DRAFT_1543251 [Suillus variegatus]